MTKGKLVFVPKGYRVVPEEPTREQLENCGPVEGYEYGRRTADRDHSVWYTAMVKESPQLTTPPVLRWGSNVLRFYEAELGRIEPYYLTQFYWVVFHPWSEGFASTEQEARRAAEKALGLPIVEEV